MGNRLKKQASKSAGDADVEEDEGGARGYKLRCGHWMRGQGKCPLRGQMGEQAQRHGWGSKGRAMACQFLDCDALSSEDRIVGRQANPRAYRPLP